MKVSENWLREWINPSLSTQELASQLTMAGLEIDSVTPAGSDFSGVVIGKIEHVEPHPNAQRLTVCRVNVGQAEPLTIVTNAKVEANESVAVALVGAYLPGVHTPEQRLTGADMRGVVSQGMFCSGEEIVLDVGHKDLLRFPKDAKAGHDLRDYYQLNDHIIEVDLTPNRGDCTSVLGLTRELSLLNNAPYQAASTDPVKPTIADEFPITVLEAQDCPRYLGRVIRGIQFGSLPVALQEKLRRSDIRSIHPVVDILNYVMLELGQPMHAFDLSTLSGKMIIRYAKEGERISVLGEQEIALPRDALVIADERGPQAIAGIMGGAQSAVSASSTDIFLESALFTAERIAGKARKMGLHTDSSYRFERGVDPALARRAMERATALITQYCGGQSGPILEVVNEAALPVKSTVVFRPERFYRVVGDHSITVETMHGVLQRLGCDVKPSGSHFDVIAPSYRYDLNEEIDFIEEIARVVGYSELKTEAPISRLHFSTSSQRDVSRDRLKRILVDLGYQEAITYSFVDNQKQSTLFPSQESLALLNPISSDMGVMRLSLWTGLLQAVLYNQNRQQQRLKLFEIGQCFYFHEGQLIQEDRLGGVVTGDAYATHWDVSKRKVDFYDLKGHVEILFQTIGIDIRSLRFEPSAHSACHPGQCADIYWQDKRVGVMGRLHPKVQDTWDLTGPIFLFEVALSVLSESPLPNFHRPSRFTENRRDIAIIVDEKVLSSDLVNTVTRQAGELLQQTMIFDVYQGKGIEPGKKSVAMGLILQHPSRTLVDEEIDALISDVVSGLEKDFHAKLRE